MRRLLLIAAISLTAQRVHAQKPQAIELGLKPDRVYDFKDIDTVNAFNGNLVVTIPLGMKYPAGGGLDYGLTLVYNSKVWDYKYLFEADGDVSRARRRARASQRSLPA